MNNSLIDLLHKPEELHPDLQLHVRTGPLGDMIHHPLIIDLSIRPGFCALVNAQFQEKQRMILKAEREADWSRYIFLHERPYRFEVMSELLRRGLLSERHWPAVFQPFGSTAFWFANRFNRRSGIVVRGLAEKENVYALFNGRGESEIVVNPKLIKEKKKL